MQHIQWTQANHRLQENEEKRESEKKEKNESKVKEPEKKIVTQFENEEKLIFNLSLHRISFLRYSEKEFLLKKLDSYDDLALLSIEEISKLIHRDFTKKIKWDGKENLRLAKRALHYCKNLNIDVILNSDEKYPFMLKQIPDPPLVLFCRGNASVLNSNNLVSVVGTRHLSFEGKKAAKEFGYNAAKNGFCVVSGLAYGADGFAHKGAVDAYFDSLDAADFANDCGMNFVCNLGKTVAVIPSGIDDVVPAGQKNLARQILKSGGCIVSEYEPKTDMAKWHYVARNRLIAALSSSTVVVEAPAGSGSLITADFALEYGREVFLHKACFCEMATKISDSVKKKLEEEFEAKKVSKYKVENTVEKFLEAGAPVVNDFADYCNVLNENPGTRNAKIMQQELF